MPFPNDFSCTNFLLYRTAIVLGTAIPLVLFLVWNAVILGTISNFEMTSDTIVDPIRTVAILKNGAVRVSLSKILKLLNLYT